MAIITPDQAMQVLNNRATTNDRERLEQLWQRNQPKRRARKGPGSREAQPLFADLPPEAAWIAMRLLNSYLSRPKNRDARDPGKSWKWAALCGAARQQAMWRLKHPGLKFGRVKQGQQGVSQRAKRVLGIIPPKSQEAVNA